MVIDLYLNTKEIYRVFIPGLDYLKDSMEPHVLEANYYASKVAVENGHDVVDLLKSQHSINEMNKLEGNQKSGKSIFVAKINE
jgi:hypothetical protein